MRGEKEQKRGMTRRGETENRSNGVERKRERERERGPYFQLKELGCHLVPPAQSTAIKYGTQAAHPR